MSERIPSGQEELRIIRTLVVGIVVVVTVITGGCLLYNRQLVRGGYCQGVVPGVAGIVWVKC